MATKITNTTLESTPYNNIYDIMDTRSNISDPRDKEDKHTRQFLYSADPFNTALDFNLLPYIILDLPTREYSKESANGQCKRIAWKHNITVRSARRGSGNSRSNIGRDDMMDIIDDMEATFNSASIRNTLSAANMKFIKLTKIDSDSDTINDKEVFEALFELTYTVRMQVY